jgi:hypothetical protein
LVGAFHSHLKGQIERRSRSPFEGDLAESFGTLSGVDDSTTSDIPPTVEFHGKAATAQTSYLHEEKSGTRKRR